MNSNYEIVRSMASMMLQKKREEAQGQLQREAITQQVDLVLSMGTWDGVDRESLIRELETMLVQTVGIARTLEDSTGHVPWLAEARAGIEWRYWSRYKQMLQQKGWSPASVESLERLTNETLARLGNPKRDGEWDRRGMVVGHVQSGKTANYTGLICKAVDAGYKLIVVLAGLTNSLRSQTQVRLDEGFLGYNSDPTQEHDGATPPIGVGLIDRSLRPDTNTHRLEKGDFKKANADHFNIHPGNNALLFVVKKNGSVLKNLLAVLRRKANNELNGRPYVTNVPLLVIDDEADHGSVNTKEVPLDDQGVPQKDYDPTITNQRIRELLHLFQQSSYVGYTATPFANIFIHDSAPHERYGDDLFPRSFITNLKAPSNYYGPREIFGIDDRDADIDGAEGLPITREVDDHADSLDFDEREGWMPPRHTRHHEPSYNGRDEVPPSLRKAILSFILTRAVRLARGQVGQHNSMLVHVTRFVDVQHIVCRQVEAALASVTNRLKYGDGDATPRITDELFGLWTSDYETTMSAIDDESCDLVTWEEVEPFLLQSAASIQVREFNGSARDVIDYETHRETGLNVIAIGGDKLARGLTLEGLSVSYFLRSSKMYDTLMQMGRWFGYRPGYIDLCRLYTTPDLIEWFGHIAVANDELRREFDHMANVGGTPKDYGLKVRSHPQLLVTSQVKMRHGTRLDISFAGKVSETTVFHRDEDKLQANMAATVSLIRKLKESGIPIERNPVRDRLHGRGHKWTGAAAWKDVPADILCEYLNGFLPHPRSINTRLIAEFIERQNSRGCLTSWTLAMLSGDGRAFDGFPFGEISMVQRKWHGRIPEDQQENHDSFVIRRVGSARDEALDLNSAEYQRAFQMAYDARLLDEEIPEEDKRPKTSQMRTEMRKARPKSRGLLLIYPIDPKGRSREGENGAPIIGMAACFPEDPNAIEVSFEVNNVYWSQEYETSD
ncbi:Z1 domain-containing protein [Bremerella cremea]|uniref:Z1 domain-containing protein n=1 Tax=Bremerella cremea TaxID=1031537 RepID=UPI0031EA47C9